MKKIFAGGAALAAVLACTQAAFAADAAYLDDRSSAEAVIRSLYNAIDRHEYARAWSYFGETKPAKDFDSFVKGYADTESVEVRTGGISGEGAAGSVFFTVPVAIQATTGSGDQKVFAGCYTLREVNGQIQEPPFDPVHIEKGALKPSDESLDKAVPEKCGDGPTPPKKDSALEQAQKAFLASYGDQCDRETPDGKPISEPAAYSIAYRDKDAAEGDPDREARLFRFFCRMAAYNESAYYYLADDAGQVRQLQFAAPELDIRYENDDHEGKVESVTVTGFQTEDHAINSSYDEKDRVITTAAKWRGVGDASSNGTYLFRDGDFALVKYDVDASYDGEINPETVVDYYTAP
jgi:hypothetical protein